MENVLLKFLALATGDRSLATFAQGRHITSHYALSDVGLEFYIRFADGAVEAGLGPPASPAEVLNSSVPTPP